MFLIKQFKGKYLIIGLLLLNTINTIYANDQMNSGRVAIQINEYNNQSDDLFLQNQLTTNNDLLPQPIDSDSKQLNSSDITNSNKDIESNGINNDPEKASNETSQKLKLKENCVEKFSIINHSQTDTNIKKIDSINDEIDSSNIEDNIFDNWTYDWENKKQSVMNNNNKKQSETKKKYKEIEKDLQESNINFDTHQIMTINSTHNVRKLSDASCSSSKSYFSNPLVISNKNKFKKIDEYLNEHKEIIPIITLQADGLQVLDTIAHLSAFNSFYNLVNFGTNPYIYCASSAALLGLSLALDLQNQKDPGNNLEIIGSKLYQYSQVNENIDSNKQKNKCCLGSCWNKFKLWVLNILECCIDYDEEDIIDSLYTKISNSTLKKTIKEVLDLNTKSKINIPNLIIKDVNSEAGVVEQVLQANKNQDSKSTKNSITLFSKPIVAVIKNFIKSDKKEVEKGINFVENNTQNNALIKISSQDEIQFIQQNNLNDSTIDRLAIIISSNVDNNGEIQNDLNSVKVEHKEVEYEGSQHKLHTIKINLYTNNSITNPNYSLNKKYSNIKEVLSKSKEFTHLIDSLPQPTVNSKDNSSVINDNLSDNVSVQEDKK